MRDMTVAHEDWNITEGLVGTTAPTREEKNFPQKTFSKDPPTQVTICRVLTIANVAQLINRFAPLTDQYFLTRKTINFKTLNSQSVILL